MARQLDCSSGLSQQVQKFRVFNVIMVKVEILPGLLVCSIFPLSLFNNDKKFI